jgi:hypothetical protein
MCQQRFLLCVLLACWLRLSITHIIHHHVVLAHLEQFENVVFRQGTRCGHDLLERSFTSSTKTTQMWTKQLVAGHNIPISLQLGNTRYNPCPNIQIHDWLVLLAERRMYVGPRRPHWHESTERTGPRAPPCGRVIH